MIRAYARKSTLGLYIVINIPSYGQLISMAGLSTLQNLRLQIIAILMYKIKNNVCPTYISTLFEQPAIKYKLCNHDFTIPRFNTVSFGKHLPRYMGQRCGALFPVK